MRMLLLAAALFAAPALHAHEGEDHSDEKKPPPAASVAPRMEANTPELQLLARLHDGKLVVHLDRYASNEPVTGARIELEAGSHKAVAQAAADGSYVLDAGPVARPGSHALIFAVEAGEVADLLNGNLEVGAPEAPPAGASAQSGWLTPVRIAGGGAAALLLLGVIWRVMRRQGGVK